MTTQLLLVEDDENLGLLLQEFLTLKEYKVDWAKDGNEGLAFFAKRTYHLCLLDVMMPKKDGFTLAKEIRSVNKEIPIIFLTAKSLEEDVLLGFKVGADDYLTKPFPTEVLLARLEAILRRSHPQQIDTPKSVLIGQYTFDYAQQNLIFDKEKTKLTAKEADLLKLLWDNKNGVVNRNYALLSIWGDDSYFNARSMDVYISKLRKYLKNDPTLQIINSRNEGFKFLIHS